jgi:hypothetical protein
MFKVSSLVEKCGRFFQRFIMQPLAFHFSWHRELLRFNGCNMSNANNEKMVHLGAKIPAHLAEQIDAIAPYFKGGKSEIVRRALAEGVRIVHEAQMLNFPMQGSR